MSLRNGYQADPIADAASLAWIAANARAIGEESRRIVRQVREGRA